MPTGLDDDHRFWLLGSTRNDEGPTWTGRGNKPRWLAAAMAQGRKVEDFLIKA